MNLEQKEIKFASKCYKMLHATISITPYIDEISNGMNVSKIKDGLKMVTLDQ